MAHPNPMPMPAKVPPGKEDEYVLDERTGELIHKGYGSDPEMRGTVLPTAQLVQVGKYSNPSIKGSFDAYSLGIEQNIVDTSEGHEVKRRVTRGEMRQEQRGEKRAAARPTAESVLASMMPPNPILQTVLAQAEARGLMGTAKKAKKAKKQSSKRRGTKRAAPVEEVPEEDMELKMQQSEAPPAWTPAIVQITREGYGVITQAYSGIFRDGMCLVLVTDNRTQQPNPMPEIEEDPLMLKVGWEGQQVEAVWAGIQFTLPNGSVTFTVLLIPEDEQNEQGRESVSGPQFL